MPGELATLLEVLAIIAAACLALLFIEWRKAAAHRPLITHAFRWAWHRAPGVMLILNGILLYCIGVFTGHFFWCSACPVCPVCP